MDQQLLKMTQFFIIHIFKDILKEEKKIYVFFFWHLSHTFSILDI